MIGSVVIVGASVAGMSAARTLRRDGFEGTVTVVDSDANTPYDRPPLSKQVLSGEWEADRIVLPAVHEDLGIDYLLGRRAMGLDRADRFVRLAGGGRIGFDGLVVATGAAARWLPGAPVLEGAHVLRTLDDCLALRDQLDDRPSRVVVIGAGFIGAEVAAVCRARDLEVTMIEAAGTPLERALGPEMGAVMANLHRDNGVDLRLGVGVDALEGTDRVESVLVSDGSRIQASVVVVGIGVVANTGWVEGSGLNVDDGIVTDETLSAAPGVVVAGDVARWPSARFGGLVRVEHWETAMAMGEAAARRLLSDHDGTEPSTFDPVPWFWSDQYDVKIQLAGSARAGDDVEVVSGALEDRRFVALYGREGRVVGVLGMNRPAHVVRLRALVEGSVGWAEGVSRGRDLA